jgi:hypothetical protein
MLEMLGGKYYPSERLIKWTDRKYFNGECTQLLNLPFGNINMKELYNLV